MPVIVLNFVPIMALYKLDNCNNSEYTYSSKQVVGLRVSFAQSNLCYYDL